MIVVQSYQRGKLYGTYKLLFFKGKKDYLLEISIPFLKVYDCICKTLRK